MNDSEELIMFPTIVCLCGSTRFYPQFQEANYQETMAGRIVLTVGFYPHSSEQAHGETIGITPLQKAELDALHLRKIDLADEVLVLNVGGYIGQSTAREISYAAQHGKRMRWWESDTARPVCSRCGAIEGIGPYDTAWRYNGDGWEHKCPGALPQAGHFPALAVAS